MAVSLATAKISTMFKGTGEVSRLTAKEASLQGLREGAKEAAKKAVLIEVGKQVAKRYIIGQLSMRALDVAAKKLTKGAAHPIKAELKRIKADIMRTFMQAPVAPRMHDIIMQDQLAGGNVDVHTGHFQRQLSQYLDRHTDQFAGIAQSLVTQGISQSFAASDNIGLKVAKVQIGLGLKTEEKNII